VTNNASRHGHRLSAPAGLSFLESAISGGENPHLSDGPVFQSAYSYYQCRTTTVYVHTLQSSLFGENMPVDPIYPFPLKRPSIMAALLSAMLTLPASAASTAPSPSETAVQLAPFGFDLSGMDGAVKPGDNFNGYANGAWQTRTAVPADQSSFGVFDTLGALTLQRNHALLDAAQAHPGSKIGDLYASFMDEDAAERKGLAPLQGQLAQIAGATDKAALAALLASLQRLGVDGLVDVEIAADDHAPTKVAARLHQSGLGLPNRQYYLDFGAKMSAARAAYSDYVRTLLVSAGADAAAAQERAQAVLAFETGLARVQWEAAATQDVDKTYNRWSSGQFAAQAAGMDWTDYLGGLGIGQQASVLVSEPSALSGAARLWDATPLPVLRDWMRTRLLDHYAPYLNQALVDAHFRFHGTMLSGTPEIRQRWKRGVSLVTRLMGGEIGKQYVDQYFPPASKAAVEQMVANLLAAYRQRLSAASWMEPATRAKALEKLTTFKAMVGYPDQWTDYTRLAIARDDLVGNAMRAEAFAYQLSLDKLDHPVDRSAWPLGPTSTAGWANRSTNVVIIPAALLQAPLFDPAADPAVNYGGVGAVIGHEISHHFDDQGRKYDASGTLSDWWTAQDAARFKDLTDQLVKQYDAYEPLPGVHANGATTLSENLADLGGLEASYLAYQLSLNGKPAPVLAGYSGAQRFFLGNAQIARTVYRPEALRQRLLTDVHAPAPLRIEEFRNMDSWYQAFDVQPGDREYLAPGQRVKIW